MRRICVLAALLFAASCGDLSRVPAPPVPLSAIAVLPDEAPGDLVFGTTSSGISLMRAAPVDSLVTLHVPDIGGSIARFGRTSLSEILRSPELEQALGPFQASFQMLEMAGGQEGNGARGPGGLDPAKLMKALKGELMVSLEQLRIPDDGQPPVIRLICGWSVRGAEDQAETLLQLLAGMAASDGSVTVEQGVVAGSAFTRIVGKTPFPYVLEGAVHGDALLLGFGRETVTDAITRIEDSDLPALTVSPSYRRAMARCAHPQDTLRLHLNAAALVQAVSDHLPPDVVSLLNSLGLEAVNSLTTTLRFEGRDIITTTLLDSPGGEDLVSRILRDRRADPSMSVLIPDEVTSFTLASVDGERLLETLRDVLPPEERKSLDDSLLGLKEDGIDLEREVFRAFGPECALVTLQHGNGEEQGIDAIWNQFLGTAVIVKIRDLDLATRVLSKLPAERPDLRREVSFSGGHEIVTYRADAVHLPPEFAISYARKGGYLMVALSETSLRALLEHDAPAVSPQFRRLLKELPEDAALITYDDIKHGVKLGLQAMIGGMASSMPGMGAMPDVAASDFDHIIARLDPSISFTVADERGVYSHTRSATGGFGSFGGISGLLSLGAVAIPNLAAARVNSNERTALLTLRLIRTAQKSFRRNLVRDADGDREGEFGFLGELMGKPRPGERARKTTALMGSLVRRPGLDFEDNGYYFRIYLPSEDGSPIGEHEAEKRIRLVDGDLAESVAVTVAWPKVKGSTGNRAFILSSDGVIYGCENGTYQGKKAPAPDLLLSQKGNLASAPLPDDRVPRDGFTWTKLRD